MAKQPNSSNNNTFLIVVLILIVLGMNANGGTDVPDTTDDTTDTNPDLTSPSVVFTGQDLFTQGTSLSTKSVRALRINGGGSKNDLGLISMNSGELKLSPSLNYKFYYGLNATTLFQKDESAGYYPSVEEYTAPAMDSADSKVAKLCKIDTKPSIAVVGSNGAVIQGVGETIGANEVVDMEVRIKVGNNKCFGNPDAPSGNAVCFKYGTAHFSSVDASTNSMTAPFAISSNSSTGNTTKCFEFGLIQNNGIASIPITLTSTSTDPPVHNITIFVDDISLDLNAETLDEIWDFEDEFNNQLGVTYVSSSVIKIR